MSEAIGLMSAELRAGILPQRVLAGLAPEFDFLAPARTRAELGGDVPAALRRGGRPTGAELLAELAGAWLVAERAGAPLARVLDRLEETARGDLEIEREVESGVAPARATGRLMAVLPVFGLALGSGMGGDPVAILRHGPGRRCVWRRGVPSPAPVSPGSSALPRAQRLSRDPARCSPAWPCGAPSRVSTVARQRRCSAPASVHVDGHGAGRRSADPHRGDVVLGLPHGSLIGVGLAPVVHRSMSSARDRRLPGDGAARIAAQLPTALDLMVAALEVGRPPVTAFALAAEATADPLGSELGLVAGRLAIAGDSEAVWRTLAADPSLAPVGRAFRRAAASGMPVAHVVSGVADDLRRERRARGASDSRKVAVRTAAPLGVCFLPAFFLIGIVPTIIATFRSFSL